MPNEFMKNKLPKVNACPLPMTIRRILGLKKTNKNRYHASAISKTIIFGSMALGLSRVNTSIKNLLVNIF